jgi:molybdate transport system ATP-binding protein
VVLNKVGGSSIQNSPQATVEQIAGDCHPALALVRLRAGPSPLLARLTQRAAAELQLAVGQVVWLQIKAVALVG